MKSYGPGPRSTLEALLGLRVEGERAAERALAGAAAARRAAQTEEARLAADAEAARAAVAAARRDDGGPGSRADGGGERAAEALARRRYCARLEARAGATAELLARHRANELARAIDADAAARAAHLRARQRREVVEKAIARRQAAARREAERREEAAMDDRPAPPGRVPRPPR